MRSIGIAERALEALCRRAKQRVAFGKTLAEHGALRKDIADSRMEIEQLRLLVFKAAYMMDTVGNKVARQEIAQIKVIAPNVALRVLDRAIQAHGALGVCQDTFLASAWASQRTLTPCRWPGRGSSRGCGQTGVAQVRLTGVGPFRFLARPSGLPPARGGRLRSAAVL